MRGLETEWDVMRRFIDRARLTDGRVASGRAIVALGAALLSPVLASSPAFADCVPNSATAVSGQTVNCTGTAPTGFRAGAGVDNLIVNVQPRATVQDNGTFAIQLNNGNTVTNNGAVTGGNLVTGIGAGDGNTITNNTSIVVGDGGAGIFVQNLNTVVNGGSITGGDGAAGIFAGTGNNVSNGGPSRLPRPRRALDLESSLATPTR